VGNNALGACLETKWQAGRHETSPMLRRDFTGTGATALRTPQRQASPLSAETPPDELPVLRQCNWVKSPWLLEIFSLMLVVTNGSFC